MSEKTISEVTSGLLAEILGELGWKATLDEDNGTPRLVSAANGVNFNIHLGTKSASGKGWMDFTLSAPFMIDREVSPALDAFWNRRNRFARVYRTDRQIVIDMDVIAGGGVTRSHLKHQFAVWSDLTRLFVRHLRADHAVLSRRNASAAGNGAVREKNAPA